MIIITPKLQKYLDDAFTINLGATEFAQPTSTQFQENYIGILARLYLNDEVFIQTQKHYGEYVDILYIEVTQQYPRVEEYLTKTASSYIGQRYLMDDSLGHFKRLYDMDCLDPIPPKIITELTKTENYDQTLHELMIWNQEHVSEIDLFIMKCFTTTPLEIVEKDYVGLKVTLEDNCLDC